MDPLSYPFVAANGANQHASAVMDDDKASEGKKQSVALYALATAVYALACAVGEIAYVYAADKGRPLDRED